MYSCYVVSDFCDPHGLSVPGIFQARILGWVAISFSRGSSWPRDQSCVSCIARRSLYHWATREAQINQFTCIQCEDCNIQFWKWKSDPMDYTVHRILQARILEWVAFPFSRVSSQPRSPALQVDSLPSAEPQRKPKNTGVGSLSLLQMIFPTQELNQGLLHCRQILYQLNYQGSPILFWSWL